MTAKEYLSRYKHLETEIGAKCEQAKKIEETAVTVSHISENASGSGYGDKVGKSVAKLIDLQNEIIADTEKLVVLKHEIESTIAAIDAPMLEQLLTLKYINGLTLEQVAERLNKSYRHIRRLHKISLKKIENVLECPLLPVV